MDIFEADEVTRNGSTVAMIEKEFYVSMLNKYAATSLKNSLGLVLNGMELYFKQVK